MIDPEALSTARAALSARIEAAAGPGAIERLDEALTHASFANEAGLPDNQRLEFLGDAVLGLCVSELLVAGHQGADEGVLTRMRSGLVNADALAEWARKVDLGACIAFGRGATLGQERQQTNVLADTVEALVAAVYQARGLDGARAFVREVLRDRFDRAEALATPDPKSALQEWVQADGLPAPVYRVVDVSGGPHDPVFRVEVIFGDRPVARGEGRSKRSAERAAALAALAQLNPSNG
jgi:ribonuclease-3